MLCDRRFLTRVLNVVCGQACLDGRCCHIRWFMFRTDAVARLLSLRVFGPVAAFMVCVGFCVADGRLFDVCAGAPGRVASLAMRFKHCLTS